MKSVALAGRYYDQLAQFRHRNMYLISKYHLPLDTLKEYILDDFNNTLTSARSVSSISLTTSRSLNYDEPPRVD
ncbi:unnamed protein product [Rotaria socialis]